MNAQRESLALDPRWAECRACGLSENDYAVNLARTADGRLYCLACLQEKQRSAAPATQAQAALRPQILYLCKYEDIYGSPPEVWAQFPAA